MSALATYQDAARIMRDYEKLLVKDRSYQEFFLGQQAEAFLRAKRLELCTANTLHSYETVLRMFTLHYAYVESLEVFTEPQKGPALILDFIDHYWGDASEETIRQRFAVMGSFFEWAYRDDRIIADPMAKLRRPRRRGGGGARRPRIPEGPLTRLVSAQETLRDQAAILLLRRLGLRREDLRLLQIGDIDLARDEIHLRHGKGGEESVLPIAFRDLREALYLHLQTEQREPAEFLLYPKSEPASPFSATGIASWFERCCERAGIVGYSMHQLRHAAADDLKRATNSTTAAQALLRHKSSSTTEIYLHSTVDDLRQRILASEGEN